MKQKNSDLEILRTIKSGNSTKDGKRINNKSKVVNSSNNSNNSSKRNMIREEEKSRKKSNIKWRRKINELWALETMKVEN